MQHNISQLEKMTGALSAFSSGVVAAISLVVMLAINVPVQGFQNQSRPAHLIILDDDELEDAFSNLPFERASSLPTSSAQSETPKTHFSSSVFQSHSNQSSNLLMQSMEKLPITSEIQNQLKRGYRNYPANNLTNRERADSQSYSNVGNRNGSTAAIIRMYEDDPVASESRLSAEQIVRKLNNGKTPQASQNPQVVRTSYESPDEKQTPPPLSKNIQRDTHPLPSEATTEPGAFESWDFNLASGSAAHSESDHPANGSNRQNAGEDPKESKEIDLIGQLLGDFESENGPAPDAEQTATAEKPSPDSNVTPKQKSSPRNNIVGSTLQRVTWSTTGVLIIAVLAILVLKKSGIKIGDQSAKTKSNLNVIESKTIGPKCQLQLVEMNNHRVLVAIDQTGIKSLIRLPNSFSEEFDEELTLAEGEST